MSLKFTDYHKAWTTIPDYLLNDETHMTEGFHGVVAMNPKHKMHVWRPGEGWKVIEPAQPMKAGGKGVAG